MSAWGDHSGGHHQDPHFNVSGGLGGGYDSDNDFNVGERAPKQGKKNNGNNKDGKTNATFEIQYEGYYLEKAEPRNGEPASWSRVGRRALPVDNARLARMSRKSKEETHEGPATAFAKLTANQQGIVNRLVAEKQAAEQNKNAEWVLACVRRYIDKKWSTRQIICKKILVIIKRQDKNGPARGGGDKWSANVGLFQNSEIIDLQDPFPKKKDAKEGKKGGKKGNNNNNQFRDNFVANEIIEGPVGGVTDPFGQLGRDHNIVDIPGPHDGGHQQQNQHPPPGSFPVNQPWPQQHQHPHPQQNDGQHPSQFPNPFQPEAQFNTPDLYEDRNRFPPSVGRDPRFQTRTPVHMDDEDHHRRHQGRSHSRSRSRSRSTSRRRALLLAEERDRRLDEQQRFEEARHQQRVDNRRIENKVDELTAKLEDIDLSRNKVENWNARDTSSDESYRDRREREDFWSDHSRASFSPPSSPSMTEIYPSGSLGMHRRKSPAGHRDFRGGYPDERHRSSYREGQIVIEPFNNTSHRQQQRRQYQHHRNSNDYPLPRAPSPGRHMRSARPRLHQANAHGYANDYPEGQRMLPQYESQDYRPAEFWRERGGGYERSRRRAAVRHGNGGRRGMQQGDYVEDRGGRRGDRVWN